MTHQFLASAICAPVHMDVPHRPWTDGAGALGLILGSREILLHTTFVWCLIVSLLDLLLLHILNL